MQKVSRTFLKLFFSYTSVLLIPMILLFSVRMVMSRRIIEQTEAAWENDIQHVVELIDRTAVEIAALSETVLSDRDAKVFTNLHNVNKKSVLDLYTIKDAFNRYSRVCSAVKGIYLYSVSSGWVMSNGSSVQVNEAMYKTAFGFTGYTFEEWQEYIGSKDCTGYCVMPSKEIVYRTDVTLAGNHRCVLILRVNIPHFESILQPITKDGCGVLLADTMGNTLLMSGDNRLIPDEITSHKESSVYTAVTHNGWTLYSYVDSDVLQNNTKQFTVQLLFIILITLILDVALCFILSRNNAAPIRRIISSLPLKQSDGEDEIRLIENSIDMLMKENASYHKINLDRQELIACELIRSLLLGDGTHMERLEELARHANLSLDHCDFGVVTILMRSKSASRFDADSILSKLDDMNARAVAFPDRIALLCFLPKGFAQEDWQDRIFDLAQKLNAGSKELFGHLCASELVNDKQSIHTAYDETVALCEILTADMEHAASVSFFSPSVRNGFENFYDYPIDMELQLIQALKMGSCTLVSELLSKINMRNCVDHELSGFMSRQLLFMLRGTIIRGLQSYLTDPSIERHIRGLCEENTINGLFERIEDLATEISLQLHDDSDHRHDELEEKVYTCISDHFDDPDLTLSKIASMLNVSERFLYDFIRVRFNSTFSKLLEGLRITEACALLRTGETNIKSVAQRVGYNSDHTFRLAFKRVMDVTPSDYSFAHEHKVKESDNV